MNSTAVWNSDCSFVIRSSTSASTVASRPVVGSSRIRSAGSTPSAIAITTRCCMPPESWCGYRCMTEAGSAIWTWRSIASERSCASALLEPRAVNTSASCLPTRIDGFSAVPGFW